MSEQAISQAQIDAVFPKVAQIIMNTSFRMFPDSSASTGKKDTGGPIVTRPTSELHQNESVGHIK